MRIDAKLVKTLRDKTGAGMMDCKKALVESDGDLENAVDYLRKSGVAKAEKKGVRETKDGLVYSYIHAGGRLGVLVELNCETDFVAKTDDFSDLGHKFAMQIAATNPMAIVRESIPEDVIASEKDIYTEQAKAEGKPDNIIEKMIEGRLNKFLKEISHWRRNLRTIHQNSRPSKIIRRNLNPLEKKRQNSRLPKNKRIKQT